MIIKIYIGKMNRCNMFLEVSCCLNRAAFEQAEAELKSTSSMLQKVLQKGMKAYEITH